MTESYDDQLARVRLMATGNGVWDYLSPTDRTALKAVLTERDRLMAAVTDMNHKLICIASLCLWRKDVTVDELAKRILDAGEAGPLEAKK